MDRMVVYHETMYITMDGKVDGSNHGFLPSRNGSFVEESMKKANFSFE